MLSVSPDLRDLLNGDPDGLTFVLGLDDFLFQAVEPDAAVDQLTYELVLADEDATLGICGGVAGMDADALELRYAEQDGKPLLHLRTPRNDYCIAAFGDGRTAFHLVGTVGVVTPSGFEGVAKVEPPPCLPLGGGVIITQG